LAIPISSPGGQGERGACVADVAINAPAAASAQVSRRMIIDRILDFDGALAPACPHRTCERGELVTDRSDRGRCPRRLCVRGKDSILAPKEMAALAGLLLLQSSHRGPRSREVASVAQLGTLPNAFDV
jgi:hypothetical protein